MPEFNAERFLDTATRPTLTDLFFFGIILMRLRINKFSCLVTVIAILCSPMPEAQTCEAGIQASNPTSVYVIDTTNGTVTDTRTGLMWDRCARGKSDSNCSSGTATTFTWQAALNSAIGTYKGYADWRLPNIKELHSLVEECRVVPSINEFAFPGTPALDFWSSSPSTLSTTRALSVYFIYGDARAELRTETYLVRLVRGGQ